MKDDESPGDGARVLVGGGIGAGKSSVVEVFRREGYRAINADDVGRSVLQPGSAALARVTDMWPETIVDGELDRGALAKIVFANREQLSKLEAVTHPEIARRIRAECDAHPGEDIVIETPVARLIGGDDFVRVAVVADPELRLARAVTRGGARDDVLARMRMQPTDEDWRAWADVVVDNTGTLDETERRVLALIEELRSA